MARAGAVMLFSGRRAAVSDRAASPDFWSAAASCCPAARLIASDADCAEFQLTKRPWLSVASGCNAEKILTAPASELACKQRYRIGRWAFAFAARSSVERLTSASRT